MRYYPVDQSIFDEYDIWFEKWFQIKTANLKYFIIVMVLYEEAL